MRDLVVLGFFASVVACSSPQSSSVSSSQPGALSGDVANAVFTAESAVAAEGSFFDAREPNDTDRGLRIVLSDKLNTCSARLHAASATVLDLRIRGDAIAPGTFRIVDALHATAKTGEAEADLNAVDSACHDRVTQPSITGTVVLDVVSDTHVSGNVDVTFAGGHLVGTFDGVHCRPGDALLASSDEPFCQP